jgi:hypothetical protein
MATSEDERTKPSQPREAGGARIIRRPGRLAWIISLCLLVFFIALFILLFNR